jgi:hypothetical protein
MDPNVELVCKNFNKLGQEIRRVVDKHPFPPHYQGDTQLLVLSVSVEIHSELGIDILVEKHWR